MNRVIYAAYGSNLLKERFLVYIKGGEFEDRKYEGCKDKTEPVDRGWKFIPHRLYFAKESSKWQYGGVAFISLDKEENKNFHAVARLWEITEEQFECVWEQEGKGFYKEPLILGEIEGIKIYSLTWNWEDEKNPPSEKYLKIIIQGLKETTGWPDKQVDEYIKRFI
jgi:hypothetical protein